MIVFLHFFPWWLCVKPQDFIFNLLYIKFYTFVNFLHCSNLIISLSIRILFGILNIVLFYINLSKLEYDSNLNWNCRNADPAPEEFKRKLPLRKKQPKSVVQSLSIDDGLNKNTKNFPSLNQRLEQQKNREVKLDNENPRFITSLKYSIKQNYNRWKLPLFFDVANSMTMEKAMMPVEFIAQQEVVIKEETNFWKLKKREEQGYIMRAGGTKLPSI